VSSFGETVFSSLTLGYIKHCGPVLQLGQELRYFMGQQEQIPLLYSFLRLKF
jgi:hypothetical protein